MTWICNLVYKTGERGGVVLGNIFLTLRFLPHTIHPLTQISVPDDDAKDWVLQNGRMWDWSENYCPYSECLAAGSTQRGWGASVAHSLCTDRGSNPIPASWRAQSWAGRGVGVVEGPTLSCLRANIDEGPPSWISPPKKKPLFHKSVKRLGAWRKDEGERRHRMVKFLQGSGNCHISNWTSWKNQSVNLLVTWYNKTDSSSTLPLWWSTRFYFFL